MDQIKITITCDEGHVADSLRQLANAYEESEELNDYETEHFIAEID